MAPKLRNLATIAVSFLRLGCLSFGGPVAHIGYLRDEFVGKRRWLDDAAFADLVALCQFLPGPASSQTVFGLGMQRGGLWGAMLATICFTLPSAVLMTLFGYGISFVGELNRDGWLHGLKLAAVPVVAQAVWNMGKRLCPDKARVGFAGVAAAATLALPGSFSQVCAIAGGALLGWCLFRAEISEEGERSPGFARHHLWAAGSLILCGTLLVLLPAFAAASQNRDLRIFDSFYRAGSLVFGGGHVILPLLRAELVPSGWVSDDAFLAGYGAAQALPGPLFTFSAYLGTIMHSGKNAWLGGLECLTAIFLPGLLLIGGALPFWHLLRSKPWAQAGMKGANAAVVGVLLAAFYDPVWTQGVSSVRDVLFVLAAFVLLEFWRCPVLLIVGLSAAAGQWLL